MNARAAWRLEDLGFARVYRYAPGKADWMAAGLPIEGMNAQTLRAGAIARRDVPTCAGDETVGRAAARAHSAGFDICVVVNDESVVLGRLRGNTLGEASEARVNEVMDDGPVTTRASDDLKALVGRLHKRNVSSILVTNPDGSLIGLLKRDDADEALKNRGKD
jgi:CBS domain-containing protein